MQLAKINFNVSKLVPLGIMNEGLGNLNMNTQDVPARFHKNHIRYQF